MEKTNKPLWYTIGVLSLVIACFVGCFSGGVFGVAMQPGKVVARIANWMNVPYVSTPEPPAADTPAEPIVVAPSPVATATPVPPAEPVPSAPSAEQPTCPSERLVASNKDCCWSAPLGDLPRGVFVPHCVLFQITDGQAKTFRWSWTQTEIDLANISGQGVGVWSDEGVVIKVVFPNGKTCRGRSFEVVPGNYQVTVLPLDGQTTAAFWQGEVRNYIYPDCAASVELPLATPVRPPAATPVLPAPPAEQQAACPGGRLVASNKDCCWSAPGGDVPNGVLIPHCVQWQITDGQAKTFRWSWTQTEIDLANISGQGVGVWSDEGVVIKVVFPNGKTCSGSSFDVVPGDYQVTVHPPDGQTTATFWQGEVRNQLFPECSAD